MKVKRKQLFYKSRIHTAYESFEISPDAGQNGRNAIISNKRDNKHDNNKELGNNSKYRQ
jgi:hypothetical protein